MLLHRETLLDVKAGATPSHSIIYTPCMVEVLKNNHLTGSILGMVLGPPGMRIVLARWSCRATAARSVSLLLELPPDLPPRVEDFLL